MGSWFQGWMGMGDERIGADRRRSEGADAYLLGCWGGCLLVALMVVFVAWAALQVLGGLVGSTPP